MFFLLTLGSNLFAVDLYVSSARYNNAKKAAGAKTKSAAAAFHVIDCFNVNNYYRKDTDNFYPTSIGAFSDNSFVVATVIGKVGLYDGWENLKKIISEEILGSAWKNEMGTFGWKRHKNA